VVKCGTFEIWKILHTGIYVASRLSIVKEVKTMILVYRDLYSFMIWVCHDITNGAQNEAVLAVYMPSWCRGGGAVGKIGRKFGWFCAVLNTVGVNGAVNGFVLYHFTQHRHRYEPSAVQRYVSPC
jgi:hypothetical protein